MTDMKIKLYLTTAFIVLITIVSNGQGDIFLMKDNLPYLEHRDTTLNKIKKDKIYQLTKQWIAKTFNNSKAVTDLDDPNAGTLIIKYQFDTKTTSKSSSGKETTLEMNNKATMQIDCRDNKIRIRTSEFQQSVDLSKVNIYTKDYQYVKDAIQRLLARGETIESISKMDLYRDLISTINGQTKSLISYIVENAKDDF